MSLRLLILWMTVASPGLTHAQIDPQAGEAEFGIQEIRIVWNVEAASNARAMGSGPFAGGLVVLGRRHAIAFAPRQRRPEIAPGQIVVMVVDAAGQEIGRTIIPDPRILRAEFPDDTGLLHDASQEAKARGVSLTHSNPEFLVSLPDDPTARELRIHEPRWNGSEFELILVATVAIN